MNLRTTAARLMTVARELNASHAPKKCPTCGRDRWESFETKQAIDALRGAATRLDRAATLLGTTSLVDGLDAMTRHVIEEEIRELAEHLIERGDA